ncbi:uncharacterized protein [Amphiura filiformis]|uniref:uncharacterized protein n=1 Tax=Amphiura filiformis TaxID=82378 RepID=UPI003B218BB2
MTSTSNTMNFFVVLSVVVLMLRDVSGTGECVDKFKYCNDMKISFNYDCNVEIKFAHGSFSLKEMCPVTCDHCNEQSFLNNIIHETVSCNPAADQFSYCDAMTEAVSCDQEVKFVDGYFLLQEKCPRTCNYCP